MTTTIVTTSSLSTMSTCVFQATANGPTQQHLYGTHNSGIESTTITTTIVADTKLEDVLLKSMPKNQPRDVKRKNPDETSGSPESEHKRRNIHSTNTLMEQILSEVVGVKTMVGKLEQQNDNLNDTVQQIQIGNTEWKTKLVTLERDMIQVKESLEMAHGLIVDEKIDRQKSEQLLKKELCECKEEISKHVGVLKNHYSEM